MISNNLELGKSGEHYALYELISQGYISFLSDQGLPYDIVVDVGGEILKGQVKSTFGHSDYGKSKNCLRFGTRSGKKTVRSANADLCDFYVFVSISDKTASFFHTSEILSDVNKGAIKQTIDLRSINKLEGKPRGRMLIAEDFSNFSRVLEVSKNVIKK